MTGLIQAATLLDINLSNVWYVEIGAPGSDNLPTSVKFYFTATDYKEITEEDAKNWARMRAAYIPSLADAPRS